MTSTRSLAAIACMLAVLAAQAQTGKAGDAERRIPASTVAQHFKASYAQKCALMRDAPGRPEKSAEDRTLMQTTAVMCECLPRGLDAWVAGVGGDGKVTQAQFLEAGQGVMVSCAARGLRESTAALCASGADPFARQGEPAVTPERRRARCACLEAGLAKLSDAQIAEWSKSSYRDHRARAQAAAASEPAPAPTPIAALEQSCKAQDAQL